MKRLNFLAGMVAVGGLVMAMAGTARTSNRSKPSRQRTEL
jgi:hypothetical protein